jgi:tRNA-(ms[2]io[6]A)-hydroxylase
MLGLKLPTDPRWANIASANIEEVLADHAWCEQKAASNAISLIVKYPELDELVAEMTAIAREEMEHFHRVHQMILNRGLKLGVERKDSYVHDLLNFIRGGGSREQRLVDYLLFAAMIEARSCERFRLLSDELSDPELKQFYYELMVSEAGHYTTFLKFARLYGVGVDVENRWREFLEYEAEIIQKYGKNETVHG